MRWARLLRAGGHTVEVTVANEQPATRRAHDLMIALHARRSHSAMAAWKSRPDRPLILALTGTDLYRDIHDNVDAKTSLQLADRLVVLQPSPNWPPACSARRA
jgi:hypothetical protein